MVAKAVRNPEADVLVFEGDMLELMEFLNEDERTKTRTIYSPESVSMEQSFEQDGKVDIFLEDYDWYSLFQGNVLVRERGILFIYSNMENFNQDYRIIDDTH